MIRCSFFWAKSFFFGPEHHEFSHSWCFTTPSVLNVHQSQLFQNISALRVTHLQLTYCTCAWSRKSESLERNQADTWRSCNNFTPIGLRPGFQTQDLPVIGQQCSSHYPLDVRQQFRDDTVRHSAHCVQSSDDGGGVEGEDYSELRETSCLLGIRLQRQTIECCSDVQRRILKENSLNVNFTGELPRCFWLPNCR